MVDAFLEIFSKLSPHGLERNETTAQPEVTTLSP